MEKEKDSQAGDFKRQKGGAYIYNCLSCFEFST